MNRLLRVGWGMAFLAVAAGSALGQVAVPRGAVDGTKGPVVVGSTARASVSSAGAQGNRYSYDPAISADGRHVAFRSFAGNLVPGDTNGSVDIFVHDRWSGTTERVSVDSAGAQADQDSREPAISGDGRLVAFMSPATNLVPGDTNGDDDVFVRDLRNRTTERVSVDSSGAEGNSVSGYASISGDGRYVAFASSASNLVPGDTNGFPDVFVRDRRTGSTERVSVDTGGVQGDWDSGNPSISADGRYVAFDSYSTNLVPGDTNGIPDVFVRDRWSGITERVSVRSGGAQGNWDSSHPSISADGRHVAFWSSASNLVPGDTNARIDVFVRDRWSGTTERVSVRSGGAQSIDGGWGASISAHGRYVAFHSSGRLLPGDTNGSLDVYVRDRWSGTTERVSVSSGGAQSNEDSYYPSISADGRHVAFYSYATDLVPGDTNGDPDIFVRER